MGVVNVRACRATGPRLHFWVVAESMPIVGIARESPRGPRPLAHRSSPASPHAHPSHLAEYIEKYLADYKHDNIVLVIGRSKNQKCVTRQRPKTTPTNWATMTHSIDRTPPNVPAPRVPPNPPCRFCTCLSLGFGAPSWL